MQLQELEPLLKISIHCRSKYLFLPTKISRKKLQTNISEYVENLKQVCGQMEAQVLPPKFFSKILCCVAFIYNSYFYQNSRFTEIIRH